MPSPVQITTAARMPIAIYQPGPYAYGGNLFVVLQDKANTHAEVWKSTDSGATWSEADSGNHPQYATSGATHSAVSSCLSSDGTKIHVSYVPNGGTQLSIKPFDMTNSTWGTAITGGPAPPLANISTYPVLIAQLSSGNLAVVYSVKKNISSTDYQHVKLQIYSGSWGSEISVFEPAVDDDVTGYYLLNSLAVDSSDRLHISADFNSFFFRFRRWSGGTLHDIERVQIVRQPNLFYFYSGAAITFTNCGLERVATAHMLLHYEESFNELHGRPGVFMHAAENNPASARIDDVHDDIIAQDGTQYSGFSFPLVYLDGALYLYYPQTVRDGGGGWDTKLRRACSKLGNWGAAANVFTPTAGDTELIEELCARPIGGSDIGLLFQSIDNAYFTFRYPHYLKDTPSCSEASACSSTTNVPSRVIY